MMWKKGMALLFGLMLITAGLAFGRAAAAETSVTVILVSDNEADSALADYLANLTGAIVVTTPWGVYDANVTVEVMNYAPDQVIIIGGPDAVVDQYVADFNELNITVERWWGENRYETNLAVIGNATVKLKVKFENSVVVVPGNDTGAIQVALRKAVKVHGIILFANNSTDPIRVMAKFQIRPSNITVIHSRIMKGAMVGLVRKLRGSDGLRANLTEMEVNVTPEMAMEAINASEERIATAEEMLANVTLPPQMERVAEKMLLLAKKELNMSKEAYGEGNYGKAYGQAIAAKAHAEFVIRVASKEWQMKVRFDPAVRAEMFLHRVEIQLRVMEKAGVNVTEVKELVEQLKAAIKNKDYEAIDSLMWQIQHKLLELYTRGKGRFRDHIFFPAHGSHGKP